MTKDQLDQKASVSGNKQFFTEEDIKKQKNAVVLDYEFSETPNLPDTNSLLQTIANVLEYMCTDPMLDLKEQSPDVFEKHMEDKYPEFSTRYYAVFKKLLSGEDISPLFEMIAQIERIQSGAVSIEKAEEELGMQLANKYIYPKIGKNKGPTK